MLWTKADIHNKHTVNTLASDSHFIWLVFSFCLHASFVFQQKRLR